MKTLRRISPLNIAYSRILLVLLGFAIGSAHAVPLINGIALHSELGTEQFIGGLYTSTLSSDAGSILIAQEEKRLDVRILDEGLSARRFKRMWIEGMAINSSPAELEKHAKDMAAFSNMLKVKLLAGDQFSVLRSLDRVEILLNGTKLGEIDDVQFFDLLLRTWIGPVPLSSTFRANLLASGSPNPDLLARYNATTPSAERVASLKSALEARKAQVVAATATAAAPPPIAKPKLDTPKIASSAASAAASTAAAAATATPKVAMAAPNIEQPTLEQPGDGKAKPPTQAGKPQKVALIPTEEAVDESIFDDEDDVEFTAEGLLKEQLYYSQLVKWTYKYLSYPERSMDRGHEGYVRVRVTIDRKGKVKNSEVLEEAEYSALTKEALKATKRASPYPEIPAEVPGEDYTFTFRIAFKLKK